MPAAFGQTIPLPSGAAIVGAMSIGQNRWMFHSRVIGIERIADRSTRAAAGLRLHAPDRVERCLRRDAYRVSTASLSLPPVECWPLLDPTSAIAAEVANRALVRELERAPEGDTSDPPASSWTLPEVGAKFEARLANVSGGGLGLVASCDFAVACESAVLGTPEIRRGLFPMMIMAVLQRVMPRRKLMGMMLLGEKLTAAEALDHGLLSHVVPDDGLDAEVEAIVDKLAAQSPTAMRMGLRAFHHQADLDLEKALPHLRDQLFALLGTEDAQEGLRAFFEKREPRWTGR